MQDIYFYKKWKIVRKNWFFGVWETFSYTFWPKQRSADKRSVPGPLNEGRGATLQPILVSTFWRNVFVLKLTTTISFKMSAGRYEQTSNWQDHRCINLQSGSLSPDQQGAVSFHLLGCTVGRRHRFASMRGSLFWSCQAVTCRNLADIGSVLAR